MQYLLLIYVIKTAGMDEALTWAAKVPSAAYGTIEVRPVKDNSASCREPG
jgi:hypothetical protein